MENGRLLTIGKAFCHLRGYHPMRFRQATDGTVIQFRAEKSHIEWLITLVIDESDRTCHVQIKDTSFERVKEYFLTMEELKYAN
jgi:hypothetical protein